MARRMLLLIAAFVLGMATGIIWQRFIPVGSLLARLGIRDMIPIARQSATPDYATSMRNWDVAAVDRGRLDLFVLMGQSNMSGRGRLDSPAVPEVHPNIAVFNKDFRWYPAREPLGSMLREVDWIAIDGGTGVGPGLAFARVLVEVDPQRMIGLIPCARGDSSIEEWQRDLSQNSLYGACIKQVRAASSYGSVRAVLFSQGESDADDPALHPGRRLHAGTWAAEFTRLVNDLRGDIGAPYLPVLFTQLGTLPGSTPTPNWVAVKQQQSSVTLPSVAMIVTEDLPLGLDAHFDTASQVEIGKRFAAAYLEMEREESH